jgi:V/A-type H+-transporting ATPase subunit I
MDRRVSDHVGLEENEPYSLDAVNAPERPDLINLMLGMGKERKAMEDRRAILARERSRIAGWGEFNPDSVRELAALGHPVYLYELTPEAFSAVPQELNYIKLSENKSGVRLAVLDKEVPGTAPLALPEKSLSAIDAEMAEVDGNLEKIEMRLKSFADRRPVLEKHIKAIQNDIDFETARAELAQVEGVPAALSFSHLSGFVPAEDLGRLKAAAAENGWALAAGEPGPDDNVPTKLKNNKLASLLNPLTDFLEVVPGYHEADISGWFLFFFVIFFGMIFGDAAYGVIILIAAIIGMCKTAKKGVPPILKLMFLLGLSNFAWGALTCTWFGVAVDHVPAVLQKISLPLISNVTAAQSAYDEGIVRQNLMIFCFSLALVQLSIGHIIAITRCRTLKVLGDLGSIAMLVGMYGIVLSLIASNESRQIPLLMPFVYLLGAGFVVNFIFTNYDGSVGKSIVESLKNIISMILGIANVFSDIMSYIRLWAVGLAGAAISSTVDTMAGPMLGHFLFFIFGIILLVFGHGLNLVLNTLSVLVHGVRLNTLEFSGHVGLTWAGTAYKPFAKNGE